MNPIDMPLPSLRRLMIYYRRLKHAAASGQAFINSNDLGAEAGASPEQVRKDLSYLPSQGRSRVGFPTEELAEIIEEYLGLEDDKSAVLVGAGNLGRALALYPGFSQFGLNLVALFDNDPEKIGTSVGHLPILPIEKLTNLTERMMIRIGVIATPVSAAQNVCNALVAGGVKAIWNFAPTRLEVPADVLVRHTDLAAELMIISKHLKSQRAHAAEEARPAAALLEE